MNDRFTDDRIPGNRCFDCGSEWLHLEGCPKMQRELDAAMKSPLVVAWQKLLRRRGKKEAR